VRLFVERGRAVAPTFQLTRENADAVGRICRRLNGLPLALELAAARLRVLEPHELLSRLDPVLPILTGGSRDLPRRQQTMRRTVAWSYELLSGDEQDVFRQLTAFAGGWTLEAAAAVCGPTASEEDVLEHVSSLIDESLVHRVTGRSQEQGAETRFHMLETIRAFGLEELVACAQEMQVMRRHADYFCELAVHAGSELKARTSRRGWSVSTASTTACARCSPGSSNRAMSNVWWRSAGASGCSGSSATT
jgi:predicted ATPase